MSAFKYFTKFDIVHKACEGQGRATVGVQHRGPRAKTTEVEPCVALVCASTDDGSPLTGGTNLVWAWVTSSLVPRPGYEARSLQVAGHA